MDNTKDALSEFNNTNYADDRRSAACYGQEITELKQQRDDLLAAGKDVLSAFVGYVEGSIGGQALLNLKAAIAKVS